MGRDSETAKVLISQEHQIQESFPTEVALKEGQRWACRETGKTMTLGAPNIKTLHTIECLRHVPSFSHSTCTQPYSYPHCTGRGTEAQLSHTQMLIDGTGIGAHPGSPVLLPAPERNSGIPGPGCLKKKKKEATFSISFFLARKIAWGGGRGEEG